MAVALIVGAGGVLGQSLVAEFAAAGYAVGSVRRRAEVADAPSAPSAPNGPNDATRIHREACDLADPPAVEAAVARAVAALGAPDVLVCNAAHLVVAPFQSLQAEDFETAWRVGVAGAAAAVRAVLPPMRASGGGCIVFSGATASQRGGARFAAFASAKFALRGLAQSLAREVQPEGIHVVHVVLDGVLRGSRSEARFAAPGAPLLEPQAVAALYRQLAEQPPSAWTHELDLRPAGERF